MPTPAFYIPNHSSSSLYRVDDIAQLPGVSVRPEFADKDAYLRWAHDIGTQHCFYVLTEPIQPTLRPNKDNPIRWVYGLVGDYDGLITPESLAAALRGIPAGKAPAWMTTTYSGKARLIWLFERRIAYFNPDVWHRVASILVRELKMKGILPGLDEGAVMNLMTPFELGTDWCQPFGDARVPATLLDGILHDVSNRAQWRAEGPEIPIEAVAEEVERRWPGRWVGSFVDGARGIRFWDAKADNPTGCTVRKLGVQAFTGEGRFLPWSELLGADFVRNYRQNRIGGAIGGVYFDGQTYYQKDEAGIWRGHNSEAMKRRLSVRHGLSSETRRGQASEVAQALTAIEDMNSVDGVFPLLYLKEDIVTDGAHRYLNISRVRPLLGTGRPREWGEGFPWLAAYLDGLFGEEQLNVFLSWLAHWYNGAVSGKPRRGHALFIAGPMSAGKTLLSWRVIGGLMGGFREATGYVLGNTSFNEDLAFGPVWAIDDAAATTNHEKMVVYSQFVKKIVANPKIEFHPKFRKAVTQVFNGRVVVTLNLDSESQDMLPQAEESIKDKVDLLKVKDPGVSFGDAEGVIERELPALADFLTGWTIPDWLKTREPEVLRFGHDSWAHPDLVEVSVLNSSASGLSELLEQWRIAYFRQSEKDNWEGNAFELLSELHACENLPRAVVHDTVPSRYALGKNLQKLINQKQPWVSSVRSARGRVFRILRPDTRKKV
jgi:hypothetical protein